MHISLALADVQAAAVVTALASASVLSYTGSMPASPETGASGTLLATNSCGSTFGTHTNGVITANAISSTTGVASGVPGYCRVMASGVAVADLTIAPAWGAALAYTLNQIVSNGGNYYKCLTAGTSATSGGPTGTATSGINDGTAVWGYVGNTTAAAGVDATTSATQFVAGGTVGFTSMTITIPGV